MKDKVIIHGVEYVPKVVTVKIEPEKVGRWKPEMGEQYWFVGWIGESDKITWENDLADLDAFEFGNCYQTESLAVRARDRQLLLVELQDFADQKNVGKEMSGCYYYLAKYSSGWDWGNSSGIIPGLVRFWGNDDVMAAITHFRDRLDLLL